jgi:hypothetical protein
MQNDPLYGEYHHEERYLQHLGPAKLEGFLENQVREGKDIHQ